MGQYNDQLIVTGAMGFAVTTFILSLSSNFYFAGGGMLLRGISWALVLSTLTTLVQQVVASWVRARALALFLAVFLRYGYWKHLMGMGSFPHLSSVL